MVVAERLVDAGFGTVLFDLSGHGDSTKATRPGIEGYVDDLVAVFDWAVAQRWVARSRVAVAGSSLGGVVALEATKEGRVTPAALVLRAAPAEVEEYQGVSCPALLLVGTRDSLLAGARAAAAAHPSFTLRTVEGASHLFEEPGTLEVAVEATVSWLCDVMG